MVAGPLQKVNRDLSMLAQSRAPSKHNRINSHVNSTSKGCPLDTFKTNRPKAGRRFDQKDDKVSNQYFCNKILKRNTQTLRIAPLDEGALVF